jgi:hypothetical protein
MVLKWIKGEDNSPRGVKSLHKNAPKKLIAKSARRVPIGDDVDSSQLSDTFSETQLNNMLEQVCDAVMPRAPRSPYKQPGQAPAVVAPTSATDEKSDVPWRDLMANLGEEMSVALADAASRLQDVIQQQPQAAAPLALVLERVEHAKRVAMIAQRFAHIRAAKHRAQPEQLSLREVVTQAIAQRAKWLQKRGVQARLGFTDASVYADAPALFSLTEELIGWAGGLAPEINIAFDVVPPQRSARLRVTAKTDTAKLDPAAWQNVGWFLWHQLAGTLGAKAELEVTQQALSVSVTFPPLPDPSETTLTKDLDEDHDIAAIVAGCRVMLIAPEMGTRQEAIKALEGLRLQVSNSWSVQAARENMGDILPHAVVYDSALDPGEVLQLRSDLGKNTKIAYVELSNTTGPDFHVSSLGTLSTAHVSVHAIAQSLAPALVFELCKVI